MTEQNKYLNGKIYKIISDYTDDVYIGSTTDTLSSRLIKHKSDFKRHMSGKSKYMTSYEIIKYAEYRIELIENYPSANKKALEAREGYYIEITPNVVNKCVVGRSNNESSKIYRQKNKEKIAKYYQANKEKKLKIMKEYRELNNEKIKEYKSTKIPCTCGAQVTRSNIAAHKRTKNHTKLIQQIEQLKQENEYYKARIQDLIDYETNQSMVDDEYNSILDSQIDTLLSDLSESIS